MKLLDEEVITAMDVHQLKAVCEAAIKAGVTHVSINHGTYQPAKTNTDYSNHPAFIKATTLDSWKAEDHLLVPVSANIDVLNRVVDVVAITRDDFTKIYKDSSPSHSIEDIANLPLDADPETLNM